ncbi:MAPK/MAK/MRK overlapping kinase isoform X2 [Spea bombifrons]|uniref:MAPK/MAK/MRK overlapping kinase isoform X2 n=1 Tax=Spea bombifrons TaxID=233779 RepID=UPI00234BA781|nr:MAPK/MAK/MRK overlapping kinase isoform X2 [Spea bombifrons]
MGRDVSALLTTDLYCHTMNRYKIISKIGEGTFSEVLKTQSLKDGNFYACKKMKQHYKSTEQVNNLREVQALRRLSPHPNILILYEVVFDRKSECLALICELMDMNIYELIKGRRQPLPENKIRNYMYQLCKSLEHIHRNGIFHRDVKPENILIKQDILKLGDFGSCRSVFSKQPFTEYISTRWYRAPECLLTDGYYTYKMDIWSAGCVFFEITSLRPLFPGSNELDQISKIHDVLGTPAPLVLRKFKQSRAMSFDFPHKKGAGIAKLLPSISAEGLSLMCAMLEYDPDQRISAKEALQHSYFTECRTLETQTLHRKLRIAEQSKTADSTNYLLRIAGRGRRQLALKILPEPVTRHHGPTFPTELPKLHVSELGKTLTYPALKFQSVFPTPAHNGKLPLIPSIKYFDAKFENQHHMKTTLKPYQLPSIDRKGGGI